MNQRLKIPALQKILSSFALITFALFSVSNSILANTALYKAYGLGLEIIKNDKVAPPLATVYLKTASEAGFTAYTKYSHSVANQDEAEDLYLIAFSKVLVEFFPHYQVHLEKFLAQNTTVSGYSPAVLNSLNLAFQIFKKSKSQLDQIIFAEHKPSGTWIPTPPQFLKPLLPAFGTLPTEIGYSPEALTFEVTPLNLGNEPFFNQREEVRMLGDKNSPYRTPDQTELAFFWAQGPGSYTPPGAWTYYAINALKKTQDKRMMTFGEQIKFMRIVSNALYDAAVVCWFLKYKHNVMRPVTAIHQTGDTAFMPLITTPPFPAYTSGHSSFSMTAATLLQNLLPNSAPVTLSSHGYSDRTFKNYIVAAEEAGMSRIYGGIHYMMDNLDGFLVGRKIACHYILKNYAKACQK